MLPLSRTLACACCLALAAAACQRTVQLHAAVCGALCGDDTRAPTDFSGLDCAVAARVRVYAGAGGSPPLQTTPLREHCFDLRAHGTRLDELFATGPGNRAGVTALQGITADKVLVEVALYAPGGALGCPADAPLVALGRSGIVNLAGADTIDVPLGCHAQCPSRAALQASVHALEDDAGLGALPTPAVLGDIFAYDPLVSTSGLCVPPRLPQARGQFRAYGADYDGTTFSGAFGFDGAADAGCVAARFTTAAGVVSYACLEYAGLGSATLWRVGSAQHLASLGTLAAGRRNGALVIRVFPATNVPLAGTTVFGPSGEEAGYVDSDWMSLAGGMGPIGVAVFPDAPVGSYTVTFADRQTRTLNAGAADDAAITTAAVYE